MSDFKLEYLSDKIHVHRWPQNSPIWNDSTQKMLDDLINKNSVKKRVAIKEKTIQIENFEFTSLKKIGITVPFFKNECTIIFEAKFDDLFAHIHITIKSENYVDVFNRLTFWKQEFFPNST